MQTSFSKWSKLMGAGAIMMVAMAGCGGGAESDNGSSETGSTNPLTNKPGTMGNSLRGAGNSVSDAAGNAVDAAGNAMSSAGNAVSNAVPNVVGAGRSAVMTPNVKEAIGDKIPNSMIDVDTNGTTKTITLKGMVKNAAQSKLAAATAKKEAPDYKIVNNLKVGGGASPMMKR